MKYFQKQLYRKTYIFCIAKIKQNKGKHPKNPKKRLYRNKNSGGVCYTALRCKYVIKIPDFI